MTANEKTQQQMDEAAMETMLYELLNDDVTAPEVQRVRTFEEAGILTNNRGLVIHTTDGCEYQISIIRSA